MRKITIYLLTTMLFVGSILTTDMKVNASEESSLSYETFSEGSTEAIPYGAYLQMGVSSIDKVGIGRVYAKGKTLGRTTVAKITVGVRVERLLGDAWVQEDYFSATNYNSNSVTASKTLTVPRGYFYRVKSIHGANSDASSSWTNGLYMD